MNQPNMNLPENPGRFQVPSNEADGPRGIITMNEDVVATIAGLAARDVQGIHSLGRWRLIPFGDSPAHGVDAEVGTKQAAFDIEAVVDYGVDIRDVAGRLRRKLAEEVDKMTGREVIEVNINIVGLHMPEDGASTPERHTPPRVI